MTEAEAIAALEAVLDTQGGDYVRLGEDSATYGPDEGNPAAAHEAADDIILRFLLAAGHTALAEKYQAVRDKIGFWYA